jgi:hypothetical protein
MSETIPEYDLNTSLVPGWPTYAVKKGDTVTCKRFPKTTGTVAWVGEMLGTAEVRALVDWVGKPNQYPTSWRYFSRFMKIEELEKKLNPNNPNPPGRRAAPVTCGARPKTSAAPNSP